MELQPRYHTRNASFQNVREVIHAIENLKIGDSSDFQTPPEPKINEPHPTKKAREDHPCPKCGSFKGKKILIKCAQCNRNYHIRCVGANKAQASSGGSQLRMLRL